MMYVFVEDVAEAGVRVEDMETNEGCDVMLLLLWLPLVACWCTGPPKRDELATGAAGVDG